MHKMVENGMKHFRLDGRRLKRLEILMHGIIKEIKPDKAEVERLTALSNEVMSRLRNLVPKSVEIITAGSIAHGTHLKGSSDIDIFMLFPKEMEERKMEMRALEIAKRVVSKQKHERYVIKYAEHPYVKLFMDDEDVTVDIVPAFKIRDASEMGSAVDRTQLHTEFVLSHLSEKQKDEVRVLKFMLGQHGIYGAEAATQGFSGYLCELLIYYYGSFAKLLEAFARLSPPVAIFPANRSEAIGKEKAELVKNFNSNFIVIDPTDSTRNVAANVSMEALARLSIISRRLIQNPEKKVFYGPRYSAVNERDKILEFRSRLGTDMYIVALKTDDIADDILWQQLKKFKSRLETALAEQRFECILSIQGIGNGYAALAFFINRPKRSTDVVLGPSAFMAGASESFMRAHQSKALAVTMYEDRIAYIEKPKFNDAGELLRSMSQKKDLPTHMRKATAKVLLNKAPEEYAEILYPELVFATSI